MTPTEARLYAHVLHVLLNYSHYEMIVDESTEFVPPAEDD